MDHLIVANEEKLGELENPKRRTIAEEMTILEEELEKLKVCVGEVGTSRSEATFTFKLTGVNALLAGPARGKETSGFYCGGELDMILKLTIKFSCLSMGSIAILESLDLI